MKGLLIVKLLAVVFAAGMSGGAFADAAPCAARTWGVLIHLGMNQWCDGKMRAIKREGCWRNVPQTILDHMRAQYSYADHVRFDEDVWREVSARYATNGVNTIILDLGEAVVYPSHPELAVKGSWSVAKLKAELARLRSMGFEVLPKLNFSASHDAWLGEYHRMVSTKIYYGVCADIIRDVIDIFDHPRYFHIGFDEEQASDRSKNSIVIARKGALWWHDLMFLIGEVERHGARTLMWVDHIVEEPERSGVYEKLPKSVLVQPWYYENIMDEKIKWELRAIRALGQHGYEMLPCGSDVFFMDDNLELLAAFCEKNVDPQLIRGYTTAPWLEMAPWAKERLIHAGETLGKIRRKYDLSYTTTK